MGLLDGDESILETGALMAIYYGQVQLAIEHKLQRLDLKQSRPFLKDGVFDNKARWGARVSRYDQAWTQTHYLFSEPSPALATALELCPLIAYDGPHLRAVIGCTSAIDPQTQDLKKLVSQYYLQGIKSVTVYTAQKKFELEL